MVPWYPFVPVFVSLPVTFSSSLLTSRLFPSRSCQNCMLLSRTLLRRARNQISPKLTVFHRTKHRKCLVKTWMPCQLVEPTTWGKETPSLFSCARWWEERRRNQTLWPKSCTEACWHPRCLQWRDSSNPSRGSSGMGFLLPHTLFPMRFSSNTPNPHHRSLSP